MEKQMVGNPESPRKEEKGRSTPEKFIAEREAWFAAQDAKQLVEKEKISAQSALRQELKEKGAKLGIALAMPNAQLPDLDVRGRFCQQRGFMVAPHDWGKHHGVEELSDKMRPFVSWESHGIKWHKDEEAVRAEMAAAFPDNPLYQRELAGEESEKGGDGFWAGRRRISLIIENWEEMKDEAGKAELAA